MTSTFTSTSTSTYVAFFGPSKHNDANAFPFSNFFPCEVRVHGLQFKSSEAAYQALKCETEEGRAEFVDLTPEQAWACFHGPTKTHVAPPDWDSRCEHAMRAVLEAKFSGNVELRDKLLGTGRAYLVENSPLGHDDFWADNGDGSGANVMGRLLMQLRETLGGGGAGVVPCPDVLPSFYGTKCVELECVSPCHFTNEGFVYNKCDAHMDRELTLGAVTVKVPLSNLPDGTGRFMYFNLNNLPALVEEAAKMIFGALQDQQRDLKLPRLPVVVTAETSMLATAHVLRTKYGVVVEMLSKSLRPGLNDLFAVDYCAATSKDKKTLYMTRAFPATIRADDALMLVDNVCTTGETLRAMYELTLQAGIVGLVKGCLVLFTEGDDVTELVVTDDIRLPLRKFAHLPIFAVDVRVDSHLYVLQAQCDLPTDHGKVALMVFQHRSLSHDQVLVLQSLRDVAPGEPVPVRLHDACFTSELFHSEKCDCRQQLEAARGYVARHGGLVIYLHQEGRGIGVANKVRAYAKQITEGLDTVDGNRVLGFPDDVRTYKCVQDVLRTLKISRVALITNNLRKVEALRKLGVDVTHRIPSVMEPESKTMEDYVRTKASRMGHVL